jgi:hypothetical protein
MPKKKFKGIWLIIQKILQNIEYFEDFLELKKYSLNNKNNKFGFVFIKLYLSNTLKSIFYILL